MGTGGAAGRCNNPVVSYPPSGPAPRRFSAPTPADGPTHQIARPPSRHAAPGGFGGDEGLTVPYATHQPPPPSMPSPMPPLQHQSGAAQPRKRSRALAVASVLVVAIAGGLVGAEALARGRAGKVVAATVKCVVGDDSSVSIAGVPPFLWQHFHGSYKSIRIQTSGNRIRDLAGMAIDLELRDVRPPAADFAGSVGSTDATLTWSVEGIKQTVRDALPVGGSLLTDVTADPGEGTIRLGNMLVGVTVKPKLLDSGGITLEVVDTDGPGLDAVDTLQPALDEYLGNQTLPLSLHPDQLAVTDDRVTAHLSSADASLPADSGDDCYSAQ